MAKQDRLEQAKVGLRSALYRFNVDLVRSPFPVQVAAALRALDTNGVLDIGANVGQYGAAIRAAGYRGRILSCEPLPDAYERLQRRAGRDEQWDVRNTAVGAEPGHLEINVAANSYSSSVLPMAKAHSDAAPGSEYVGSVRVPVTTVADLVEGAGVDPARTLLKIDTQGYEAPVLDGAGDLLGRFAAVQLELSLVSLYDGQALAPELTRRLEDAGFDLHTFVSGFSDPRTGRLLQYDGLFVRRGALPA